ncbi:MAG: DUF4982 domain-containing protein [Treponema sp.]|jgi:hypothetical protein|nr:DUF4982 domain-containing protein [Treponema sp.]
MNTKTILSQLSSEEKAGLCSGLKFWFLKGVERLRVPSIMATDGPHGIWKNCESNRATDAHMVDLLLNGKCIGRKRVKNCQAVFKTRYAPGKLIAVTYDINDNETGARRTGIHSGKLSIRVKPEQGAVRAGDIAYIAIELAGENGVVECNADTKLTVTVEGGELLAFGSVNPCTEENYKEGFFTTYYDRSQAVLRANQPGTIVVSVRGENLDTVQAVIVIS